MNSLKIVIDTSVVVKWFASEEEKDVKNALNLLKDIRAGRVEAVVAEFLFYEVGNVLFWGKQLSKKDYITALHTLFSIPFVVCPMSEKTIEAIYTEMEKFKLTLYDIFPLVIAKEENSIFVSADEKHHKNLPNVILLSEYKESDSLSE